MSARSRGGPDDLTMFFIVKSSGPLHILALTMKNIVKITFYYPECPSALF
ncbi:hypothetical protein J2Z66_005439 [Paenibacillus eucommiae]|uniref:Uncharacterized protein n=1 Tax=Paenibacillus eucommiae TaxID=1355755 RepID=A0ABS4J1X1_9BACL|nr:hypothetical protein [Paenibacillus eucommiae]